MKKSIRRLLSVLLSLVLTVGIFPGTAAVNAASVSANGTNEQSETPDTTTDDVDAFWNAMSAYDAAVMAFWEKPDAFDSKYNALLESGECTQAQWEEMHAALKEINSSAPSLKQVVETAYTSLNASYNSLTEEDKNAKDTNDPESVSPKEAMEMENGPSYSYPDIQNWDIPTLPDSPNLEAYLDKLGNDSSGIYPLLDSATDALTEFQNANEAYQTELDAETPDSSALESLYQTAVEKYNALTSANTALEQEYKALAALYQKVPDDEKSITWDDGNGVSIEWDALNETMAQHRENFNAIEKPASLGKNVKEEIQPGAPQTKLVYTDKDTFLTQVGLTDEEKSKASIEVVLKVSSKNMTAAESTLASSKLPDGYVTGCTLDLSMYLNLNGSKERDITKTASPINIIITIPQNLINQNASVTRSYKIIRLHGDSAQVLDGTYNPQDHTLNFSTDSFSTYVIIYKDVKTETPGDTGTTDPEKPGTGQGQNSNSPQNPANNTGLGGSNTQTASVQSAGAVTTKAVKTGDATPLAGLFAGMAVSLVLGTGSIGYYVWRRKKRLVK